MCITNMLQSYSVKPMFYISRSIKVTWLHVLDDIAACGWTAIRVVESALFISVSPQRNNP